METEQELKQKIAEAKKNLSELPEEAEEIEEVEEEKVIEEVDEEEEQIEELEKELDEEPEFKDNKQAKAFAKMRIKEKEAREERERVQAELQELKERIARQEGALESRKQEETKEEPQDPEPDSDVYPEAHMQWQIRQQNKNLERVTKELEEMRKSTQVSEAEQVYNQLEMQHIKDNPDYENAKSFLIDAMTKEAKIKYPSRTEGEIRKALRSQELSLIGKLASAGLTERQIFSHMKNLAEEYGYKQSSPKSDDRKVERNRARSLNLSDAPNAGDSTVNIKSLNKMSNEDMEAMLRDPKKMHAAKEAVRKARLAMLNG